MRKIYEASGKLKRFLIEDENDANSYYKCVGGNDQIEIEDFVMIGSIDKELLKKKIDIKWCLNGLLPEKFDTKDITIIEPLSEHYDEKLININETDTYFDGEIVLSSSAIILMSVELYEELIKDNKYKRLLKEFNVRLYEGEKDLALEMLFVDKGYTYVYINENGYTFDKEKHGDLMRYNYNLVDKEIEIQKKINNGEIRKNKGLRNIRRPKIEIQKRKYTANCKLISAYTDEVEGSIELDDMQGATDIGKIRKYQEDAVLLIKDKENPKFKMMVVADGVGGSKLGEMASHVVIDELKDWFENLTDEQKEYYYSGIEGLKQDLRNRIKNEIQDAVINETMEWGQSTLVCAIVGKNDTLVANVGDSRAYIVKDGKLIQVSREDTVAQINLESGKTPTKEASRFDKEAHKILQCIGMQNGEVVDPNIEIIDNKDYDMLLLFTDGVTDCLSDEDIAVACKTTDKKKLAEKIVEKAISHDSILEGEELLDYCNLYGYIPGGKDNTTAAVYIPKKDEER